MKSSLIAVSFLLGAVVLFQSGCAPVTEAPPAAAAPAVAIPPPVAASPNTIPKIWRDSSKSAKEADIKRAVEAVIAGIRRNLASIDGAEVVRFGNGRHSIWSEHAERFGWGPAPNVQPFVPPDMEKAPLGARLYQNEKEEYIANARATYETEKARALSEYNKKVDSELARLERYLLEAPSEAAPCTKFKALRLRMETEDSPRNIVLTDGWADCDEKTEVRGEKKLTGKVGILLVTREHDTQADEEAFGHRKAYMMQVFPGATVIPAVASDQAIEAILR